MVRVIDTEYVWEPGLERYEGETERAPHPPNARVEAIAQVDAKLSGDGNWSFALDTYAQWPTERERVESFVEDWLDSARPQLVTFNGRASDIPVLFARMLRYGIQAPSFFSQVVNAKRYESKSGHLDLHDMLGSYGAQRKGGLNDWARCIGWPGKLDVDGSDVLGLVLAKKTFELNAYCLQDAVQTMAVHMRLSCIIGRLTIEQFSRGAEELLRVAMADERTLPIAKGVDKSLWLNCEASEPVR